MNIRVKPWRNLFGAVLAGLVVVTFCLVLLWHDPVLFWKDDYQLSILPVFADVARSWNEGHLPLLSPYSWVCNNLAGEFQYGTFSVFVNLAVVLIWKLPLSFAGQAAALSITHLLVLAMGAFLFARDRQLSVALSLFVALVATLNGWIVCWGATDWFGALAAFAWLPWAWWSLERAVDPLRTRWRFLWPAPFVYLLVTGGFPYTIVMLLLLIGWLSIKSLVETRKFVSILPMIFGIALGFGLSAPAWLALFDYVQGSAREASNLAHFRWLVPPGALPAFILPSWTVKWVDFSSRHVSHAGLELACGLVAPTALIAGFIWRGRLLLSRMKWDLLLLALVLALSMLPTAGLFQWSFRWLPFVHLLLGICAAQVLHIRPGSPTASASVLILVAVSMAMVVFNTAGEYGVTLMLTYFHIAALWAVGEWFLRDIRFRDWAPVVVTFATLLAAYLCIPTASGLPRFNLDQRLLKPEPLDPQRLYLSIYPAPETYYRIESKPAPVGQIVRPGSMSMWGRLRFVNGYSPIRPAGVAREFWSYVHGEFDPTVALSLLTEQAGPDGKLALLGVDGITVAREVDTDPQPTSEWQLVFSNDEGRVFHRHGPPISPVRSLTSLDPQSTAQFSVATISRIDDSRNYVTADIDVPAGDHDALIIFSRPYFRGYVAHLGDERLLVDSYRGLFPIVRVPPGSVGRLVLNYRPGWLIYGGALSILSALVIAAGMIRSSFVIRNSSLL